MLANIRSHAAFSPIIQALGMLLLVGFFAGCNLCGNEIGYEEKSPSGKLKAVAFERDCGATTHASTQISVLQASQPLPNEPGNIFSAEGDLRVRMEWKSETNLQITYPPGARVTFKGQSSGVSVEFMEGSTR